MIDISDYSDTQIKVDFQLADVDYAASILSAVSWVRIVTKHTTFLTLEIAIQQIPEVVRILVDGNVAVYGINSNS
jgi:hypothetical protein